MPRSAFLNKLYGALAFYAGWSSDGAEPLKFSRHQIDLLHGNYFACGVAKIGTSKGLDFVLAGARGVQQLFWYEYPHWKKSIIADGVSDYGVACIVTDVDGDGRPDVIISEQNPKPGLAWYRSPPDPRTGKWDRFVVKTGDCVHDMVLSVMRRADASPARGIVTAWKRQFLTWLEIPSDPTKTWPDVVLHDMGAKFEGIAAGNLAAHGRTDIVCAGSWFEAPVNAPQGNWKRRPYSSFRNYCRAGIGDFNGDGLLDIVLAESEYSNGRLAWYEAPADPERGEYKEHILNSGDLYFAHTLGVADFDCDGRADILIGEMGQGGYGAAPPSHSPRLIVYHNDGKGRFTPHIISQKPGVGIHEGIVVDVNGDGKPDIIGKNAIYRPEKPPHRINPTNVNWWKNISPAQ